MYFNQTVLAHYLQSSEYAQYHQSITELYKPLLNKQSQAAAILIAIIAIDKPYLILTKRAAHLHAHPGQICLPGGICDKSDEPNWHTATRETHEELGVVPNQWQEIGDLGLWPTLSGFTVSTQLGTATQAPHYQLNAHEVDYAIHLPLSFLIHADFEPTPGYENDYPVWQFHYEHHCVWGFTANILHLLRHILIKSQTN